MSHPGFAEFVVLVRRNLEKNGFPEKRVTFPIEKLYEEADRRGFSFNTVRDHLRELGIHTELTDQKVVFSTVVASDSASAAPIDEDLLRNAQEFLRTMTSDERERLQKMMENIDPSALDDMRTKWETMTPEERAQMLAQARHAFQRD